MRGPAGDLSVGQNKIEYEGNDSKSHAKKGEYERSEGSGTIDLEAHRAYQDRTAEELRNGKLN